MVIDPSKSYSAVFELEKGEQFEVELYADKVPRMVNNFVFLAREGFYDGVTFHRVLEGFMAQTGDPTGTGTGGPGYRFESEFHPDLSHDSAGILSMANAGGLATNGSQFFITFRETAFLDHLNPDGSEKDCAQRGVSCHSVFGKVTSGMAVVNNITRRNPSEATTPGDVITTIRIEMATEPTPPPLGSSEGIRQSVLRHEFSHGIVVDDTMSEELLSALFFYEEYLDREPLEEVRPEDISAWCSRMIPVLSNYVKAPDKDNAPIITDNLEAMKEESLYCIDVVDNPAAAVSNHYRWFGDGFAGVAIDLQLALHRMGLMYAAREYRYTLQDITDFCFDAYYRQGENALHRCLAERLILKVPIVSEYHYDYDDVRRFME